MTKLIFRNKVVRRLILSFIFVLCVMLANQVYQVIRGPVDAQLSTMQLEDNIVNYTIGQKVGQGKGSVVFDVIMFPGLLLIWGGFLIDILKWSNEEMKHNLFIL